MDLIMLPALHLTLITASKAVGLATLSITSPINLSPSTGVYMHYI